MLTFNGEKWENKEGINGEEKTAVDEFTTINGGLLSECKVALSPNQDLHGYSEPWVGGAGKNKAPYTLANLIASNTSGTWNGNVYTLNGVEFTVYTDDGGNVIAIKANGQNNGNQSLFILYFTLKDSNTYIVSGCPSGGASSTYEVYANLGNGSVYDKGSGAEITAVANYNGYVSIAIRAGYNAQNLMFYPMLRLSTESDPTFESYSNICPITGHTEAKVGDVGKNRTQLIRTGVYNSINGSYGAGDMYAHAIAEVEPNTTYTISVENTGSIGAVLFYRDVDGLLATPVTAFISSQSTGSVKEITVTTPSTAKCLVYETGGTNTPITKDTIGNVQIEEGSTATPYVPYNGYQITVNLGGTYYSGTLDVVTGVFVPDTAEVVYDGSNDEGWNSDRPNYRVFISAPDIKSDTTNIISSAFRRVLPSETYQGVSGIACSSTLLFVGTLGMSVADWRTFLSNNPLQVNYKLATPTPIQLSPTMVKALVGENHLDAPLDGQEIDEVKYTSLAGWNDVVQDSITSNETTWSSDKINTNIGTVSSSVTALASRVGTNETNIAGLTTRVGTLETNASKITWSNSVNALVNDTTVTISDAKITTASIIEPFYSNASGDNVVIKNQTATTGQVVLTFDALLETTSFRVRITNL